jgi:hypothetical protein
MANKDQRKITSLYDQILKSGVTVEPAEQQQPIVESTTSDTSMYLSAAGKKKALKEQQKEERITENSTRNYLGK